MTDKTEQHDELTKAVMNIVSDEALWSSPELYTPIRDVELMDIAIDASTAERIIALVRADERKRIREELEAMYDKVKDANTDIMGGYSIETAGMLEGLSAAIGLTDEGGAE